MSLRLIKSTIPVTQTRSLLLKPSPVLRSSLYRSLATAAGKDEEDYEIDLISMKKTPRKKRREFVDPNSFKPRSPTPPPPPLPSQAPQAPSQPAASDSFGVDSNIKPAYKQTVNEYVEERAESATAESPIVANGALDETSGVFPSPSLTEAGSSLVEVDLKALDEFVGKYEWELNQLRNYIFEVSDEDLHFYRLSPLQLESYLSSFEEFNDEGAFAYFADDFSKMILNLRRILLTYKHVPQHLDGLLTKWEFDLSYKIFNFLPELRVIAEVTDLRYSDPKEISDLLQQELQNFTLQHPENFHSWGLSQRQ